MVCLIRSLPRGQRPVELGGVEVGKDARCSLPKWRSPHTFHHIPTPQARPCRFYPWESLLNLTEIADRSPLFASQGGLFQPSLSIVRSEGNRRGRPRRNASKDRAAREVDRLKDSSTTSGKTAKSSSQEEIIALFKRIQTSISKRGPAFSKRRSPTRPKEKQTGESVPGSRRHFVKQKKARDKDPSQDETVVLSEDETTENAVPSGKFEVSRPVSNFVKRSPIPSLSLPQENIQKVTEESMPVVAAEERLELQKLGEMKLPELKELAKKRGVKGYSKRKKGELLELLKGLLQSS